MTPRREPAPDHPIVEHPHQYRIAALSLHAGLDGTESFLDLTLQRGNVVRRLRFAQPQSIEIELGFHPVNNDGMVILDVRDRQLDGIGVRVDWFEGSAGGIRFWARTVIDLDESETFVTTIVLETGRLTLRHLTAADAPFILRLVNEPSWLQYIGDKGVRTLDDARAYIANGPAAMIAKHGFGLDLVQRKDDGTPIGICGLIKRDTLDDVDLGFAFVPEACGNGYAREAAAATMERARQGFGLERVVAITSRDNERSIHLLERIGFRFERLLQLNPGAPELRLFGWQAEPRTQASA